MSNDDKMIKESLVNSLAALYARDPFGIISRWYSSWWRSFWIFGSRSMDHLEPHSCDESTFRMVIKKIIWSWWMTKKAYHFSAQCFWYLHTECRAHPINPSFCQVTFDLSSQCCWNHSSNPHSSVETASWDGTDTRDSQWQSKSDAETIILIGLGSRIDSNMKYHRAQ